MIFLFGFIIIAAIIGIIMLDPMIFGCACSKFPRNGSMQRIGASEDANSSLTDKKLLTELKKEKYDKDEIEAIMKIVHDDKFREPLLENLEELKYRRPKKDSITYRKHIGQRKLLMNEVIFLTEYGHLANTVVYAGAAPGQHTPLLLELFPDLHFELWDPAPFEIKEGPRIKIYNDYFTNESAAKYAGKRVLFISDIRSGKNDMSYEAFEEQVEINNQYQIDWINIMKPVMSMLKFRIPFTIKSDYEYFDGKIYLQPWAPIYSAETRLITDGTTMTKYNPMKYEDNLYYFNVVVREFQTIPHDIELNEVEGLCYCYDCNFEIYAWKRYIQKIKGIDNTADVKLHVPHLMNSASKFIGRGINLGLHGFLPEVPVAKKRKELADQLILQETK